MRLIFEETPSGSSEALEEAARLVGLQGDGELEKLLSAASREPGRVRPHRVFMASPEAIAAGESTTRAVAIGWRCLLPVVPAVALDLVQREGSATLRFSGVSMGTMTQGIVDTLARLEKDRALDADVTPGLLRLPSLNMDALWLKGATTATGLVIPVALAPEGMSPGTVYSEAEFNRLTADAAHKLPTARPGSTDDDLTSLC